MFISISNLINSHTTSGPCLHYRSNFNWTFIKINALSGYTHSIWLHWTGIISWMRLLYATSSPTALADDQRWWLDCCGFCSAVFSAAALSVSRTLALHAHSPQDSSSSAAQNRVYSARRSLAHQSDERQRPSINNPPCKAGWAPYFYFFIFFFGVYPRSRWQR